MRIAVRLAALAATAAVCLAQLPQAPGALGGARPTNVAATVLSMTGRVSVLKGSQPWALNPGDTVGQQSIIVTGPDGNAIFQVNDGSTWAVYPNSRVTFRNDWSATNLLEVILGKIKVHVQRWGGQPNNTSVSTPTAVISVRGTTFDVEVDASDTTVVAVMEGEVAVRHRLIQNEKPRILRDGEQLHVYKNVPLAKSRVDKGAIVERAAGAFWDALNTAILRGGRGGAGSGGGPSIPGSRGPVGDTAGGDPQAGGEPLPAPPPPGPPPPPK